MSSEHVTSNNILKSIGRKKKKKKKKKKASTEPIKTEEKYTDDLDFYSPSIFFFFGINPVLYFIIDVQQTRANKSCYLINQTYRTKILTNQISYMNESTR